MSSFTTSNSTLWLSDRLRARLEPRAARSVSAVPCRVEPDCLLRDGALCPFAIFDAQADVDIQVLVAVVFARVVILEEVARVARDVDVADFVGLAVGGGRRADLIGVNVEPRHAARCARINATVVVAAAAQLA